jgi:tetratricopeptide (TPR) repeat protein
MRRLAFAFVLAAFPCVPAFAQGTPAPGGAKQPEAPSADQAVRMLKVAYEQRDQGNFDASSAVFREAIRGLKGDLRARVLKEMSDMYVLQAKYEKALKLWHEEKDNSHDVEILLAAKRGDDALAAAKKNSDAKGEGRALELLNRQDEALEAYGRGGANKEKGDLLMAMKKPADAAKAYDAAKEDYLRAVALEAAGDAAADKAWGTAREVEKERLDKQEAAAKDLKRKLDDSKEPVERERARYDLAAAFDQAVVTYDRLATIFEKGKDLQSAARFADVAVKASKNHKAILTNLESDKFGVGLAKLAGVDARIVRLEEHAGALKSAASGGGSK